MNKKTIWFLAVVLILIAVVSAAVVFYFVKSNNNGRIISNITSIAVQSSEPIYQIQSSPFGVTGDGTTAEQIISYSKDIGFKSVRLAGPQSIYWDVVNQKGWTNDSLYKSLNDSGLELSIIISGGDPVADNRLSAYGDFVKSVVTRYPYVKYWEIDNEPDFNLVAAPIKGKAFHGDISMTGDYALMLKTAYGAIKSVNPKAKVAIGSMAYDLNYFEAIFKELEKLKTSPTDKFFDVFNFHYYGSYDQYTQVGQNLPNGLTGATLPGIKALLDKYGYNNIETIMTETATWSGSQNGLAGQSSNQASVQTEAEQASSLLKRYVYPIANGVDRIDWYSPFVASDSFGLIASGGKKLSYYAYKLMAEKLEGADWVNAQTISDSNGIYIYKIEKNGKPIWVAWNDNSVGQKITINLGNINQVKITEAIPKYNAGNDVADYSSAFNTGSGKITSGELTITLGESPIYIEQSNENLSEYIPTIFSAAVNSAAQQQTQPQGNTQNNPRPQGYCGDGICGPVERANPALCPQDCK